MCAVKEFGKLYTAGNTADNLLNFAEQRKRISRAWQGGRGDHFVLSKKSFEGELSVPSQCRLLQQLRQSQPPLKPGCASWSVVMQTCRQPAEINLLFQLLSVSAAVVPSCRAGISVLLPSRRCGSSRGSPLEEGQAATIINFPR
jgi:hypothetical protein